MSDRRRQRADAIRAARERKPAPTYEEIALEVGCCVKTVYNVLAEKSWKTPPATV